MAGFTELRALAATPPWRRWAVAAVLGRLLGTMVVLAYVLIGEDVYGSIAVGALLAGAATFSAGLAAPLLGRLIDRRGLRAGVVWSLRITLVVLAIQVMVVALRGPITAMFVLAVVQGIGYAAVPGAYRALLVPTVAAEDLPRANTVDAVLTEVGFVTGPVVATIGAALAGPLGVLGAMVATTAAALVGTRRLPEAPPTAVSGAAPWRRPAARLVYAGCFIVGTAIGLLESSVAARVVELGASAESAGIQLTLVALGSGVAGVVVSTREDQRGRPARRALLGLAVMSIALAAAATAPTLVLLGGAMFVVGMPFAPLNALGAQRLQDVLEPGQLGEGFAAYTALILVGVGVGDLLTGRFLDTIGAAGLLWLAGAVPLVALFGGVLLVRRRSVAPVAGRSG